ncbi:hypothetical protein NGA_0515300 [Nannochloropsis gaditana CCMP526]|uniref:uncharacterized protein n=1 Tax=Nannochloropsis gaditana (strain CCMP526) TaxID=1093141 RepID=UPI00029F72E0|nr:hypothetical protein NGA_0515300 [Nannochloropsis gaditana CCMP526]EKU20327.1 hypothetical protein NGA_0515300 [Nannochloropsis gaditana CCMP526]|eukprot:XP_005856034.1 hypothetical protein NGA_0515300 [Nannochloropsis gaditana CCMP526]
MGSAQSNARAAEKRAYGAEFKERRAARQENKLKLETKWKASMAGNPITAISPLKPKMEAKPEPVPPAPLQTNRQRVKELLSRNQK